MKSSVLGIDIGGTFTDFVLVVDGKITVHKRLTTADDPSKALLDGIDSLHLPVTADIVHGSTIATNALLERRGAKTALITTQGFSDVLEIGRQNRPELFALVPTRPEPLVPPEWRFEIPERVAADGLPLVPIDSRDIMQLVNEFAEQKIESVAISFLFSFINPGHEEAVANVLSQRPGIYVSLSSQILPEYREYERTSTTVINAYVAPLVDRYLTRVENNLGGRNLRIMQSSGGVITAHTARKNAAKMALSGPAGGAVGAFHVAQRAGFDHIISFDMGGTSTDVALFPGQITHTREAEIGGLPLRLPVIDIHTVGAGGGSIARVDDGGALRVGPESAGANPGPACYGVGSLPTTTDANLVLGRLLPDQFLGGDMVLDQQRASEALDGLAQDMSYSSEQAAADGVIRVANAVMERAIRAISVERGYDPRRFVLVPFGGAGPLHACAIAGSLCIPTILIPLTPGVLSALGMTVADLVKDYSQTVMSGEIMLTKSELDKIFRPVEEIARQDLIAEGISVEKQALTRQLDMRYVGQSHELTISQPPDGLWQQAFHNEHERRYGYQQAEAAIEVVTVRLRVSGETSHPEFPMVSQGGKDASHAHIGYNEIWFNTVNPDRVPIYRRDLLMAGNRVNGPAIVTQLDTTIVVDPGWNGVVDKWGNLLLKQ